MKAQDNLKKEEKTIEQLLEENRKSRKSFVISFVVVICIGLMITFIFNSFFVLDRVVGASMEPTLKDNKILLLRKYNLDEINNGDIIVFKTKMYGDSHLIKRVIAKGGDTIEIKGTKVILNGTEYKESYIKEGESEYFTGVLEIPEGYFFVMGDNRDESSDSRDFGLVSVDEVAGVALFE